MGWDEIDFNLIQPGMITGGGLNGNDEPLTLVSFAEYLNVFGRALDERYNMVTNYSVNNTLILPDIRFEAGEIRNDIFWDKYRDLLRQYWLIYTGNTWFKSEILNDENLADSEPYEIEDQDIIDLIGQEVFDIYDDIDNAPRFKIFRADVINAIYTMYEYLTLRKSGKTRVFSRSDSIVNGITVYDDGSLFDFSWLVFSGSSPRAGTAQGAISNAYQQAEDFGFLGIRPSGNSRFIAQITQGISKDEAEDPYKASVSILQGVYATLLCKDLGGSTLNMDFYPTDAVVDDNYVQDNGVGGFRYIIYNEDLPFVPPSSLPEKGYVEPMNISQIAEGTRHHYFFGTEDGKYYPFPPTPPENDIARGKLKVSYPGFVVDVNNSALEFSI